MDSGLLRETSRFAGLELLFWASIVFFEAFLVPYLTELGYQPARVGLVMSGVFGLALIGAPLFGSVIDRVRSPRLIVASVLVFGAIVVRMMPFVSSSYAAILAIALLYSLSANSMPAVLDAWIMKRGETGLPVNYGLARGFGSLGFALGALLMGYLTERFGLEVIFASYLYAVLAAAAIAMTIAPRSDAAPAANRSSARAVPDDWITTSDTGDGSGSGGRATPDLRVGLTSMLANPAYLVFLASAFLAFAGFRAAITFLPLLVEQIGGGLSDVGIAHSIAAVSEVPFLFLSSLLFRRIRGRSLIAIVLALLGLRVLLYTIGESVGAVYALQATHGMTFGLFLAGSVDYIHRIAPPDHRSLYQALAPSVYLGLGSIFGSWLGGVLVEATSVIRLYHVAAGVIVLAAPLPFVLRGRGQGGESVQIDMRQEE
jgi:MFS transporter, PPP family, 3-phenylpropionic acid transporter